MADRWVADASVLAALAFGDEVGAAAARAFVAEAPQLLAPDLLRLELASVGAKKVWRGEATEEVARAAIETVQSLLTEIASSGPLAPRAFTLAARHRVSAYDAVYLALAEASDGCVATLDQKLARAASDHGLGDRVRLIS